MANSGNKRKALSFDPPIHPGEILREQYLEPLALSAGGLARLLNVPRTRIERIIAERTGITPDTALRLARHFGTTPNFWLNMQVSYDLAIEGRAKAVQIAAIPEREAGQFFVSLPLMGRVARRSRVGWGGARDAGVNPHPVSQLT